jgi:hypothetical protein
MNSTLKTLFVLGALLPVAIEARADDAPPITIHSPVPYAVIQRVGFDPRHAHSHQPGGPTLGHADLLIRGEVPSSPGSTLEARILRDGGSPEPVLDWSPLETKWEGHSFTATLRVPAGGWYRFDLRQRAGADEDKKVLAEVQLEPFGVGDVFIVAGQSYASNANDEVLNVADPQGRVAAFNLNQKTWAVANDPQPTSDNSDGGSIWPPLGDALVPLTRVPVGFANVSYGGTSSAQWLPGQSLHQRLVDCGKQLGQFRAVLWQQGESDVIGHVPTATYVQNIKSIREQAASAWGVDPPWLLAKSTLHPTVYDDPEGEGRIRAAIDELCQTPGFRHGPDTDILDGENRGPVGSRRHFSPVGQRRAAQLWFASIWEELNRIESRSDAQRDHR